MNGSGSVFSRALSKRQNKKSRAEGVDLNGLFTLDKDAKKPSRDEEKKINELAQYLSTTAQKNIPEARVEYVVRSKSTEGDFHKAFELIELFQSTVGGLLKPCRPEVKMLGAVNRDKVTCYLDALLFAMFAKPDVFEAILFNNFDDEPRTRLVIIIRLWVNLLRTGRLVTTDITQHLQNALADCGWEEAAQLRQQDVSEAFGFITDQLKLPLLTLKTDIYHSGKEEATDDHKFITERLLDVAIPEEVQNDAVVTLEACLEDYFNNRVEVKRELQRRLTREAGLSRSDSMDKGNAVHIETAEVDDAPGTPTTVDSVLDTAVKRPDLRARTTSIFSQRQVHVGEDPDDAASVKQTEGRPRGASIKKEVSMPAWQFLNLIPWYTDTPNASDDERQAQSHFSSKRPMLGICLKRYKVSPKGTASRLNTKVDIPLEMSTPYFAVDDSAHDEDLASNKFKLVLQSVVCHRGVSVNSGHYVSMVRIRGRAEPSVSSAAASLNSSPERPEPVQDQDTWLMMDDLAADRVTTVNIRDALRKESPYLLFYRVVPIAGEDSDDDNPPPYDESESGSIRLDQKTKPSEQERCSIDVDHLASRRGSIMPNGDGITRSSLSISERRQSLGFLSDSRTPSIRPDCLSTQPTTPGDEERRDLDDTSRPPARAPGRAPERSSTDAAFNGKFFAKVTSRLSRDKLGGKDCPEIVVNEVPAPTSDTTQIIIDGPNSGGDESPTLRPRTKEKTKGMAGLMGRRSSVSDKLGKQKKSRDRSSSRRLVTSSKEPDRDCTVM